jgi:protein-tyrosine phosphatase
VAAARMIDLLRQTNVTIRVASAGLIHKANRGPSNISRVVAAELGVDISAHQSVAVTPQMLDEFELIVVMESLHLKAISRRNKNALQRSYLLSSFDPADKVVDVPDPYGKDRREFQDVYRRVVRCVDELYRCVQKNNNDPL